MNIIDWLLSNQNLLAWIGLSSVVIFVISILSLPLFAAMIPEDYFVSKKRKPASRKQHLLGIWLIVLILKNIIGLLLITTGILMLFLPGQGILTIVTGLIMSDYPGKFSLERKIASHPRILSGLNWLRKKAKRPNLKMKN